MSSKQIQYSTLSNNWKWLVRKMQETNFGWFVDLNFVDGEPQIETRLHSVIDYRFGGENGTRPEAKIRDFPIGKEVRDFQAFSKNNGTFQIQRLQIKHGLPFRAELEKRI